MQKMSGLDLGFAVAEMARLQGKRIAKIRETEAGIFLFKIGSSEFLFEPGVRLHLTRQQLQATERPHGFVSFLRKNFEGKTAQVISQVPGERIVEITTKSKERLVFELFRKGNLVAIGEDGVAAACLFFDEAGGRKVARGEKYAYPKAAPFEAKQPEKVAFCAQEEGGAPVSFSCDSAKGGREFPSFSEMADYYYANQREESDGQKRAKAKLEKLQERLSSQEEALSRLGGEKAALKQAGDAVFSNCGGIDDVISLVRRMKKEGRSEEEINAALSARKARVKGAQLEMEL